MQSLKMKISGLFLLWVPQVPRPSGLPFIRKLDKFSHRITLTSTTIFSTCVPSPFHTCNLTSRLVHINCSLCSSRLCQTTRWEPSVKELCRCLFVKNSTMLSDEICNLSNKWLFLLNFLFSYKHICVCSIRVSFCPFSLLNIIIFCAKFRALSSLFAHLALETLAHPYP